MPWTLYRYILRELLKLLLLSTAVLVVIISFAAAIRPLSEGLLGPTTLMRWVVFMMPTMLNFALPFAATFSGTMVFSRMAADNEIVACRAAGLSYLSIILPVATLGVALMVTLFILSNWIVPRFCLLAEQQLERDLARIVVTQVNKGLPWHYKEKGVVLFADAAQEQELPADAGESGIRANRVLMLQGVVVGHWDSKTHRLRGEVTAQQADAYFYRNDGSAWMKLNLRNGSVFDPSSPRQPDLRAQRPEIAPFRIPSMFDEKPQFLSWPELRRIASDPSRWNKIRASRMDLVRVLAVERLTQTMETLLRQGRRVELRGPLEGQRYFVHAPNVVRQGNTLRLDWDGSVRTPVRIEIQNDGMMSSRWEARKGELRVRVNENSPEPRIDVELDQARVFDALDSPRAPAEHVVKSLPYADWPLPIAQPLSALSTQELLQVARAPELAQVKAVHDEALNLARNYTKLGRKILAQLHERAASSVGCLLVILLGTILSISMRGVSPLVVYFWAFLLTILALVILHGGSNLASDAGRSLAAGLAVMWSGNLLLLGVSAALYLKLARN